jgi:hypothetical protein
MCIMEVRKGQHSSTIGQACAHNVKTVEGDLQLFRELLGVRSPERVPELLAAHAKVEDAYRALLSLYGTLLGDEADHTHPFHGPDHGAEDVTRARRYETRREINDADRAAVQADLAELDGSVA